MTLFSLVYQGEVHPSSENKVIPAEAYSQLIEATEIIEKAHEDAARLLEETKKECEQLKAQAKKAGTQEGLATYNEQILQLGEEVKKVRLDLQTQILPLALTAAKKIVSKQLELFPETIVEIVLKVLQPVSESRQVTIYVNKEDKEVLDTNRPRIKEIVEQASLLTIQERDDVERGGCIIKTESGMVNATSENQWRALERAFDKYYQAQKEKKDPNSQ